MKTKKLIKPVKKVKKFEPKPKIGSPSCSLPFLEGLLRSNRAGLKLGGPAPACLLRPKVDR